MSYSRMDLARATAGIWGERRDGWPPVTPRGKLFMGDAIHQLGERLHGGEWTGKEPVAGPVHYYEGRTEPAWAAGRLAAERWARVWQPLCQWLVDGDLPVWGRSDLGDLIECRPDAYAADDAAKVLASCRVRWVPPSYFGSSEWLLAFVDKNAFNELAGGRKPGETPAWWPDDGETAKSWCERLAPLEEAKRRARLNALSPGVNDWSKALAVMWAEARGVELSWKSFQQYLLAQRANRTGAGR